MSDSLVEIHHLSKLFPLETSPALSNISVSIPEGQIIGVVGPDGAGKTTLLRLMAALLLPTEGSITIAGYDTVKQPELIHFLTGYMPQKFGLYEDLTVLQNLTLYADLRGVVGEERKATFTKLLAFTGLAPFTDRLAKNLSGGMKQKLGLACTLVKKPKLLLLDEPSVGVDPISRRELWSMVTALLHEGISVLWSTAYLDEAALCHKVLLLNEGKLLYFGEPKAFTERVEGRVYKIGNIKSNRRQLLIQCLQQENVMDGVIQGNDLRILVKENESPLIDLKALNDQNITITPTTPRFEDAFIDILGGGPGGFSELADKWPVVTSDIQTPILAENLTKKFGSFVAVDDISCSVRRGEIFGFLGPNGAGKSTTFKMLCGLLNPTHGKSYVNDLDLQVAPGKARAEIGYMAQKFSLYGTLSVLQNLAFFSGIYNLSGNAQTAAMAEMVKVFEMNQYVNESADLLPLGYKQRLSLACATMHHPDVLFLDEPTSGVDPIVRREFWNHIYGLVEKGVTVMVTTHFMDEAEYCDRIALIYRGKIIYTETPDALKGIAKSPEHPNPTLEDAFIKLIEDYDSRHPDRTTA